MKALQRDIKTPKEELKKKYNINEDTYNAIKEEAQLDDFWYYTDDKKPKLKIDSLKFKWFLERNGFKVVADEVKKLAAKTQSSLTDSNHSVDITIKSVNFISSDIIDASEKLSEVSLDMEVINETIGKIYDNSNHSNSFIENKKTSFEHLISGINVIEKIQEQLEILENNF